MNGTAARPVFPRPMNQHKNRNRQPSLQQQPNHPQIQVLTSTASLVPLEDKSLIDKTSRVPVNVAASIPVVNDDPVVGVTTTPVQVPSNAVLVPQLYHHKTAHHQSHSLDTPNIGSNSSSNNTSVKRRNHQDSVPTNRSTASSGHENKSPQQNQGANNGPISSHESNASGQPSNSQFSKNYKVRAQKERMNSRRNTDSSSNQKENSPRSNSSKASSFDLEATAFPPLPGAASASFEGSPTEVSQEVTQSSESTESSNIVSCNGNGCLADVVKGTASKSEWSRRSSKDNSNCSTGCAAEQIEASNNGANNGSQACDKEKELLSKASQSIQDHDVDVKQGQQLQVTQDQDNDSAVNGHVSETESEVPSKVLSYCDVVRKAREKAVQDKREESVNQTSSDVSSKASNRKLYISFS